MLQFTLHTPIFALLPCWIYPSLYFLFLPFSFTFPPFTIVPRVGIFQHTPAVSLGSHPWWRCSSSPTPAAPARRPASSHPAPASAAPACQTMDTDKVVTALWIGWLIFWQLCPILYGRASEKCNLSNKQKRHGLTSDGWRIFFYLAGEKALVTVPVFLIRIDMDPHAIWPLESGPVGELFAKIIESAGVFPPKTAASRLTLYYCCEQICTISK